MLLEQFVDEKFLYMHRRCIILNQCCNSEIHPWNRYSDSVCLCDVLCRYRLYELPRILPKKIFTNFRITICKMSRDSSVCILVGQGSGSKLGGSQEIFCPLKWLDRLYGTHTDYPHLAPRWRMSGAMLLLPPYAFIAWVKKILPSCQDLKIN